ncbi:hypothetical protein C8R45DRAFT_892649 [Mycena sanguinolenta]|nr:hypothetical protein C8R45DRAFT_892649 [Mycena sanguinolenta]
MGKTEAGPSDEVQGPAWATNGHAQLLEGDSTGAHLRWRIGVELWWALEFSMQFASPLQGFGTAKRPEEMKTWIKYARATTPTIKNIDRFIEDWGRWWYLLNPEWRKGGETLIQSNAGSMEGMRKPGANGFLGVLIGLKWWRDQKGETSEWVLAFDDVTWVMRRLLKRYALCPT